MMSICLSKKNRKYRIAFYLALLERMRAYGNIWRFSAGTSSKKELFIVTWTLSQIASRDFGHHRHIHQIIQLAYLYDAEYDRSPEYGLAVFRNVGSFRTRSLCSDENQELYLRRFLITLLIKLFRLKNIYS